MPAIHFFEEDIVYKLRDKIKVRQWITAAITEEGYSLRELTYVFCSDEYLLKINQEYLDHDTYTDIITFDNSEDKNLYGDIFISIKRIIYNSLKLKKSFYDELKRVIIHAVLHLIGYKDKKETEKYIMSKKEEIYFFFLKKKYVC